MKLDGCELLFGVDAGKGADSDGEDEEDGLSVSRPSGERRAEASGRTGGDIVSEGCERGTDVLACRELEDGGNEGS